MKKYLLFSILVSFCLFLFPSELLAHSGSLKGGIYDETNKKPLEGANVFIKELNKGAVTDVFGTFFFPDLKPGTYQVAISFIGYETVDTQVVIVENMTVEIKKNLQQIPINLKDVVIIPQRELSFSTVSGIDLQLRPTNSAQDLLKLVPGLFIAQHAGGGKAEQIFMRGFDIDHGTDISIKVDGMPVNMVSHAHGQGYADLHFLIPELVDKVNFGKGPYNVEHGNLATAGWVDFTTKKFLDKSIVKMEGGLYGNFRTLVAFNLLGKNAGQNGKQSAYIAGEYTYNRGYFDAAQNFNRFNIFGKYTNFLSSHSMLSVSVSAFRSNWTASGQIPTRLVNAGIIDRFGSIDSTEGGITSRYNLNVQYSQSSDNNKNIFKTNVFLTYYDFELYSNFTYFKHDSINGDQIRQKEKRVMGGYNASYTLNYQLGKMQTKTELGAGFRYDNSMDNELSRTKMRVITTKQLSLGNINETNIYGFANQTFFLTPRLVLNAGVRFDYFIHDYEDKLDTVYNRKTVTKYAFSPKAGIYYNFSNKARVFFNFGVGFHTNDTRVIVRQSGANILPLATSYDLGVVVKPFKKLLVTTSLWLLDLDQEFVYVGDEAIIEQAGRSRRMGIDVSVRYEILKWLYLDGDFNYSHGRLRDKPTGKDYIPLAPPITAIGGLTFMYKDCLSASVRFRYMSNRAANEDNSIIATGYGLMDAVINFTKPRYEFGIQAQNLLNTAWNEAQFATESKLKNETTAVNEIHFTPGTPIFVKFTAAYKF
jgi:outer membrane receptor protein involved in Fe transport